MLLFINLKISLFKDFFYLSRAGVSRVNLLISFTFFGLDKYSYMGYNKIASLMQRSASGLVYL
jgi:hypothetical protein